MNSIRPADFGIQHDMTEQQAIWWASDRWCCRARTEMRDHPMSIGDKIAEIHVTDRLGQAFVGYGYSGMAPQGWSMWAKAACDLARREISAGKPQPADPFERVCGPAENIPQSDQKPTS